MPNLQTSSRDEVRRRANFLSITLSGQCNFFPREEGMNALIYEWKTLCNSFRKMPWHGIKPLWPNQPLYESGHWIILSSCLYLHNILPSSLFYTLLIPLERFQKLSFVGNSLPEHFNHSESSQPWRMDSWFIKRIYSSAFSPNTEKKKRALAELAELYQKTSRIHVS